VVAPLRRGRAISGRSDAGKIAEIMDEVSLVGVAIVGCNHTPVNGSGTAQRRDEALQPAYARKALWSEPHLVAKPSHQGFRQQPDKCAGLCDGYSAVEERHDSDDCPVPRAYDALKEYSLKHTELVRRGGRLTETLAE
jgi:hypothetical protein